MVCGAFFLENFALKKGFPNVFSKCDLTRVGPFFFAKIKDVKKPNIPKYAYGNMPEAQI